MTTTETRHALDRCKEILLPENWETLSYDQKAFLCNVICVDNDPINILLAYESFSHPLKATIKKHRWGVKKFFLEGVLVKKPQNAFSTKEDALAFAESKGIVLV